MPIGVNLLIDGKMTSGDVRLLLQDIELSPDQYDE